MVTKSGRHEMKKNRIQGDSVKNTKKIKTNIGQNNGQKEIGESNKIRHSDSLKRRSEKNINC